ncbi:hypothetical protein SAMN05421736_11957 [Evansella caseinilytica]|uniref:Uncharacterized protein n=1 Tax=Evansella caseinilytica TaxID=1503961 RepID=A0A1H3U8K7_9BACI|nr:hypothetical protein [Evansella caseinilytica]SDZ58718.1 hypothetical protein SAMN05421736_11957 [Evansella caseinilytica]
MNHYYWYSIWNLLNESLLAEQMVCSMSTQLFHVPETSDVKGNAEMHSHLVPASYHRVTAAGSAYRLSQGEFHESIVTTLIACVQKSLEEDADVKKWLFVMRGDVSGYYRQFIEQIIAWQQQAERTIAAAQQQLQFIGGDDKSNTTPREQPGY